MTEERLDHLRQILQRHGIDADTVSGALDQLIEIPPSVLAFYLLGINAESPDEELLANEQQILELEIPPSEE